MKHLIKLESPYLDACYYYYNTKTNSIVKYDRFTKKWSSKIDIDIKNLKFYKRRTSKKNKRRLKSSNRYNMKMVLFVIIFH